MPRGPVSRELWPKCVRCGERHKKPDPWHYRRRTYAAKTEADPWGIICGTRPFSIEVEENGGRKA